MSLEDLVRIEERAAMDGDWESAFLAAKKEAEHAYALLEHAKRELDVHTPLVNKE